MYVQTNALLTPTTAFIDSCLDLRAWENTPRSGDHGQKGDENVFERAFKGAIAGSVYAFGDEGWMKGVENTFTYIRVPESSSKHQTHNPDTPPATATLLLPLLRTPPPLTQSPAAQLSLEPTVKKRKRNNNTVLSAEDQVHKRAAFLERNRVAAGKCRSRRRDWVGKLEDEVKSARAVNAELKAVRLGLLEEVSGLRRLAERCDGVCEGVRGEDG